MKMHRLIMATGQVQSDLMPKETPLPEVPSLCQLRDVSHLLLPLVALLALLHAETATAQNFSGAFLLNRPGLRSTALGNTGVVASYGAEALFWNPANVGQKEMADVVASYSLLPVSISQSVLGTRLTQHPWLNLAAGVNYYDYGNIDLRTGPSREADGSLHPYDLEASVAMSLSLNRRLDIGVGISYITERLVQRDQTVSASIGASCGIEGWRFATSISHLFGDLWGHSLPRSFQLGASRELLDGRIMLFAAGEHVAKSHSSLNLGCEYTIGHWLAIQGGYVSKNFSANDLETPGGLRLGTAIRRGQINLGYQFSPIGEFSGEHSVSLTYDFNLGGRRQVPIYSKNDDRVPILLMPFTNSTDDTAVDWLPATADAILKTELSNSQYFRLVDVPGFNPLDAKARKSLLEDGVSFYISGSYTKLEEKSRIGANIHDLSDNSIAGGVPATGDIADLASVTRDLARKLDERLFYLTVPEEKLGSYRSLQELSMGDSTILILDELEIADQLFPAQLLIRDSMIVASLRIKNVTSSSMSRLELSYSVPGLTSVLRVAKIPEIKANSSADVQLSISIDRSILAMIRDLRRENLTLTIEGFLGRSELSFTRSWPLLVYPVNQIDWSDSSAIAAFVDPRIIESIAPDYLSVPDTIRYFGNLAEIIKATSYLAELQIKYRRDPLINYHQTELDWIKFPVETVQDGVGDCDDMSVLMASLLQGIGIPTRIVITADHVFMLAATGLHPKRVSSFGDLAENVLVDDNEIWIPIECTAVQAGFTTAWKLGAELWKHRAPGTRTTDLRYSQCGSGIHRLIGMTDRDSVWNTERHSLYAHFFENEKELITAIADANRRAAMQGQRDQELSEQWCTGAMYHFIISGDVDSAIYLGTQLLQELPNNSGILSALGSCYASIGEIPSALELYRESVLADSVNLTPIINMAVLFSSDRNDSLAISLFAKVLDKIPEAELRSLLGIDSIPAGISTGVPRGDRRSITREALEYKLASASALNRRSKSGRIDVLSINAGAAEGTGRRKLTSVGDRGVAPMIDYRIVDLLVWNHSTIELR